MFVNTVFYEITLGLRVVINFTVKIHNKTTQKQQQYNSCHLQVCVVN